MPAEWLPPWWSVLGIAAVLWVIGRLIAGRRGATRFGEFDVRHEIIDECFAKRDMNRSDCEAGCVTEGTGCGPHCETFRPEPAAKARSPLHDVRPTTGSAKN